jgi:hypothetical protein
MLTSALVRSLGAFLTTVSTGCSVLPHAAWYAAMNSGLPGLTGSGAPVGRYAACRGDHGTFFKNGNPSMSLYRDPGASTTRRGRGDLSRPSSAAGLQDRRRHLAARAGVVIIGRGRFDLVGPVYRDGDAALNRH